MKIESLTRVLPLTHRGNPSPVAQVSALPMALGCGQGKAGFFSGCRKANRISPR